MPAVGRAVMLAMADWLLMGLAVALVVELAEALVVTPPPAVWLTGCRR